MVLTSPSPQPHPSPAYPPTSLTVGRTFLHVEGPVPNGCLAGHADEAMHMPGHLQGMHDLLGGGDSHQGAWPPPLRAGDTGRLALGPLPHQVSVTSHHPHPSHTVSPPVRSPCGCPLYLSDLPCPKVGSQSSCLKPTPPIAIPNSILPSAQARFPSFSHTLHQVCQEILLGPPSSVTSTF